MTLCTTLIATNLQNSGAPWLSWTSPTPQGCTSTTREFLTSSRNLSFSQKLPKTALDCTNNPFHALKQDDCENEAPSASPWSPPPLPALVPRTPAPALRVPHFQQATPTWLVLLPPHSNLSCCHFQGCLYHQAPCHYASQLPTGHRHA